MFGRYPRVLNELVRNPGRVARRHSALLPVYKTCADLLLIQRRRRLRRLASTLPPPLPHFRVPEPTGYVMIPPPATTSATALLHRCDDIVRHGEGRPMRKAHLESMVGTDEIDRFREFLDFGLDPLLLGAASAYLRELPVLATVDFWHSRASMGEWQTSQLYHRDLDDSRQMKVFLFVTDVTEDSGPLTVVPAAASDRISRALHYRPTSGNFRITDDAIRPLLADGDERPLTGPRGTIVLVDTSRVLHFGSRVSARDRYVVVVQYLTPTNFMRNPFFRFEPWRYAHLSHDRGSTVDRAVLGA